MKLVRKDAVHYDRGYLIDEGMNVVGLPAGVAYNLNHLEKELQQALYMQEQPDATPAPTLDGHEFESEHELGVEVEVPTPTLDEMVEKAKALDEEIDGCRMAKELLEYLGHFKNVLEFVSNDTFIEDDKVIRLDLKHLGDPLRLTKDDIVAAAKAIVSQQMRTIQ